MSDDIRLQSIAAIHAIEHGLASPPGEHRDQYFHIFDPDTDEAIPRAVRDYYEANGWDVQLREGGPFGAELHIMRKGLTKQPSYLAGLRRRLWWEIAIGGAVILWGLVRLVIYLLN